MVVIDDAVSDTCKKNVAIPNEIAVIDQEQSSCDTSMMDVKINLYLMMNRMNSIPAYHLLLLKILLKKSKVSIQID